MSLYSLTAAAAAVHVVGRRVRGARTTLTYQGSKATVLFMPATPNRLPRCHVTPPDLVFRQQCADLLHDGKTLTPGGTIEGIEWTEMLINA